MLDAPIQNLMKTSLMCLFVTEVKYGSKEMELLNISERERDREREIIIEDFYSAHLPH